MTAVTIYHNPRCSKSRQTLALLETHTVDITVVDYIKHPMTTATLKQLLALLCLTPATLIRKKEALFKTLALANKPEQVLLEAMIAYPKLIERPIVVKGKKAVIGRPPENIEQLF